MDKFNIILAKDMDRIIFGNKAIISACEKNAIENLLVTDDFIRKSSPGFRKELTRMFKQIEENGGEVHKLSSLHPTGESN